MTEGSIVWVLLLKEQMALTSAPVMVVLLNHVLNTTVNSDSAGRLTEGQSSTSAVPQQTGNGPIAAPVKDAESV